MLRLFRSRPCLSVVRPLVLCSLLLNLTSVELLGKEKEVAAQPRVVSTSMNALSREVGNIAGDASLSRAKKSTRISTLVREVLATAIDNRGDRGQLLDITLKVTRVAAAAAPRFADVIAGAVALSPTGKESGAAGQIRAAAYEAAKSPEAVKEQYLVAEVEPAPTRLNLIPVPLFGSTPAAPSSSEEISESSAAPVADQPETVASVSGPTSTDTQATEDAASDQEVEPATAEEMESGSGPVVKLDDFVIEGQLMKNSTKDLQLVQKKANVSIDYLSKDQMAKFSASDLAEAVNRLPGVSVANGQFAVVRGLSDRFLSTTLNGLKLPSPDPEKQAFQLDLIPTSAVEAVVVSKSYEAGLWAESTGGAMNISTRTIPDDRYTSVSLGFRVNDNLFDGRLDYPLGRGSILNERFGFGSKSRLTTGKIDPSWRYVPNRKDDVPLGVSVSLEHANIFQINDEQQVGLLLAFANSSKHKSETGTYVDRQPLQARPGPTGNVSDFETDLRYPQGELNSERYASSASEFTTTASLQLGYKLSENHALELSTLWVQTGNDESFVNEMATETDENGVTTLVGPPNTSYPDLVLMRANEYFRERNLTVFQLSGKHKFLALGDPAITWSLQRGKAEQLDHPFSEVSFATPLADLHESYEVIGGNSAPSNPVTLIWAENEEVQTTGRVDSKWTFDLGPIENMEISTGVAWEQSERDRAGTALDYQKPETGSRITGRTPNEAVSKGAEIVAGTRLGTFTYLSEASASREINAAYIQASLPLPGKITLSGGARIEDFSLTSGGFDAWAGTFDTHYLYATKETDPEASGYGEVLGTQGDNTPPYASRKWYPGLALKWEALRSLTLRLSYSRTDGRPSFREVGPYFNKSVASGNLVVGNPALKPSEAENLDARLEWRPDKNNSVSVSYFKKTISNPIEKFTINTRPTISLYTEVFINNPGEAELSGFEAEVRHGLGTWTELLNGFSIGGNFTHITAEVPEHPAARRIASAYFADPAKVSLTRRLYDQPEYIANFDLTWAKPGTGTRVTLAAYAVSDTLASARLASFNFDLYERAYTAWDLIYSQNLPHGLKLKFTVKNLTDPVRGTVHDREETAETVGIREYRAGREYGVSLEARF